MANKRAEQITRRDDNVGAFSVSLKTLDTAILGYVKNVIRPVVSSKNTEATPVQVIYASPERWSSIKKDGILKDDNGQIILPVITLRRSGINLDTSFPIDPQTSVLVKQKWSKDNRYDSLTARAGFKPATELYYVNMPKFITADYDFILFCQYTNEMNQLIETFIDQVGRYWSEDGRYRFRVESDSFSDDSNATDYTDETKFSRYTFSLTLSGYILNENMAYIPTTKKKYTPITIAINYKEKVL